MKKIICVLTIAMAGLALQGCAGMAIPDMTPDEEKLVAEYAAGLLLKYDDSFENGILSEEQLAKAKEKERIQRERDEKSRRLAEEYLQKTEAAEKESSSKDKKNKDKNDSDEGAKNAIETIDRQGVGNFLGMEGLSVEYDGYRKVKSYPESGNYAFSVDAANGKELVLADMTLSNVTTDDVQVDMFNNSATFNLVLSDGSRVPCSSTLLLDDFSIYKDTVSAGAKVNTILLFEVNENVSLEGAYIDIKDNDRQGNLMLN